MANFDAPTIDFSAIEQKIQTKKLALEKQSQNMPKPPVFETQDWDILKMEANSPQKASYEPIFNGDDPVWNSWNDTVDDNLWDTYDHEENHQTLDKYDPSSFVVNDDELMDTTRDIYDGIEELKIKIDNIDAQIEPIGRLENLEKYVHNQLNGMHRSTTLRFNQLDETLSSIDALDINKIVDVLGEISSRLCKIEKRQVELYELVKNK